MAQNKFVVTTVLLTVITPSGPQHAVTTRVKWSEVKWSEVKWSWYCLLTSRSGVLLEKLTGSKLVKKFPTFMEPESSLSHSQVSATFLILSQLDPVHAPHPTSWISILILLSHLACVSQVVSFLPVSPPNPVYASPLYATYIFLSSHSKFNFVSPQLTVSNKALTAYFIRIQGWVIEPRCVAQKLRVHSWVTAETRRSVW